MRALRAKLIFPAVTLIVLLVALLTGLASHSLARLARRELARRLEEPPAQPDHDYVAAAFAGLSLPEAVAQAGLPESGAEPLCELNHWFDTNHVRRVVEEESF